MGLRVWDNRFGAQGLGQNVWGVGFRAEDLGFRALGFRADGSVCVPEGLETVGLTLRWENPPKGPRTQIIGSL